MKNYIKLGDLDVYRLARECSLNSWQVYQNMTINNRIILGNQFIRSIDSIGANIAEGYGRYHYLDKVKFYYIARASLFESTHWLDLLNERELIDKEYVLLKNKLDDLHIKLNSFIKVHKNNKSNL